MSGLCSFIAPTFRLHQVGISITDLWDINLGEDYDGLQRQIQGSSSVKMDHEC